ncbi:MAG TPA: RNA 3'-terminal phosphate cyclase [Candidatus Woesearchaeota archaeon]|nr:RNA 3'-terminal phosphate cyclase [Candidatus Woesearchaeota archaeon]
MIEIDGSYLEGGGQVIRTSIALSAVTGKAVKIFNVRANRQPPGLKAQHLTCVKAVGEICSAEIKGNKIGASELVFIPGEIKGGSYSWDIKTAGSATLVMQALLPAAVFLKKNFTFNITGGTHLRWSPPYEYFEKIFCNYLSMMGADINPELLRHGFYPKGGGRLKVRVAPAELKPVELMSRGEYLYTNVHSVASNFLEKREVADRQLKAFKKIFKKTINESFVNYIDSDSPGSNIHACACYENCRIGAEEVGELRKTAEQVGKSCAEKLIKETSGSSAVDSHMADQAVPYLALYGGKIAIDEISMHTKTNMWVCEQFLPVKFKHENGVLTCKKQ